ncbi:MAG: hypothetical protein UV82_C0008G0013 [Candidatus Magasanikbacteria bacterium GW2011_GWD2_43_18]|uniref:Uncharacterized protein n=1 Tax=Candidatus Magasanikbacteria bacterium GW2011_GWE2_42_7 TaxID=1619052 RepID=A0A0G1BGE4_9BACT|nr:MAG: hypothetical protein UV18_C0019G0006 [Candidatus Magasanikbacteria bacterium GW2011_GWC2_42_27]KKS72259.1 MAG: hypothetical protein UV42_C0011G0017 [Candidatus Magasanikbacteria bacterium GW2011_GWE2_42_7]KKT04409.1 MAG: hypothetical protein UV82_C0008G0013 [Candidatus Magasanikbacteria bacterium GW2011_GWD2_43_18]KKT25158.1 MAG: hypothetical protein UW10_C0013G0015 [Candidatus Magasanikbacteria bacterium GW2011_GWA2_43_9]HBB37638.1 hypothetical protein [Candidatus Magasanikbacteria bac
MKGGTVRVAKGKSGFNGPQQGRGGLGSNKNAGFGGQSMAKKSLVSRLKQVEEKTDKKAE